MTIDIDEMAPSLDFLVRRNAITRREREVVRCVASGMRNREIAAVLGISPHTLRHHITHIRRKLGVHARREICQYARTTGLD